MKSHSRLTPQRTFLVPCLYEFNRAFYLGSRVAHRYIPRGQGHVREELPDDLCNLVRRISGVFGNLQEHLVVIGR